MTMDETDPLYLFDPFEWLDSPEAWEWIEDLGGGHNELATLLAVVIDAIEKGHADRAIASLRVGLHECFPYTEEFQLALKLWELNLSGGLPFELEPIILLRKALKESGERLQKEIDE